MKKTDKNDPRARKLVTLAGWVSALIGSITVGIEGLGLCACFWAPLLSFAGIGSIVAGFFSNSKFIFIAAGFLLIILSFIMHKKKKVCRIHSK